MKLPMRMVRGEDDYWRIRSYFREVYLLISRLEISWQAYRVDYCRWHIFLNIFPYVLEEAVALWEIPAGEVAGLVNPEGRAKIFIKAHPL